jgi:hypothetical protein
MAFIDGVLVYINPIFFYYSFIFIVSKLYQWIFNTASIWQCMWNKVIDVLGDDREFYSVWIVNSYSYLLYWLFGSILLVIELTNKPKALNNFKIQQKTESGRLKKINDVSSDKWFVEMFISFVKRVVLESKVSSRF